MTENEFFKKKLEELSQHKDGGEKYIYIHTCIEDGFAPTFQKFRHHKKIMKDVLNHFLNILEQDD